jgi:hypothetical protein
VRKNKNIFLFIILLLLSSCENREVCRRELSPDKKYELVLLGEDKIFAFNDILYIRIKNSKGDWVDIKKKNGNWSKKQEYASIEYFEDAKYPSYITDVMWKSNEVIITSHGHIKKVFIFNNKNENDCDEQHL